MEEPVAGLEVRAACWLKRSRPSRSMMAGSVRAMCVAYGALGPLGER